MRRLKIAFLSRWYWEENRRAGGAQASGPVQQLAEAMAEIGHEVVVLSQSPQVDSLERSKVGALEVWLSPREKRRPGFVALRDKLAKFAYGHRKVHSDATDLGSFLERRGPFDVLWAHCEEPDGLIAAQAASLSGNFPPVLLQIQSLRYRFHDGRAIFTDKPALRRAFRAADRILANSSLVAACLEQYAGASLPLVRLKEKVRVVTPNMSQDFSRAAQSSASQTPMESNRILFLGALNEKKGALIFLEAALRSSAARKGAVFAVTGKFTEKNPRFERRWESLAATATAQLGSKQLELLGKISASETIVQIRRASVVVAPSLFDEWSRVVVEALALERPVITTQAVGAASLLRDHDCGIVVAPNDPEALADAIDASLRPSSILAENAQRFAHRVLHDYSASAIARQVAHHLEEIAAPPAP